jgi:hypothetical protein
MNLCQFAVILFMITNCAGDARVKLGVGSILTLGVCLLTCIWTAWLLSLSLTSRSLVAMVHLHMFGNLALELGSIEIVFGKFLYT